MSSPPPSPVPLGRCPLLLLEHLQRRGAKQNFASHWAQRKPLDHNKATQTEMVRAHNKIYRACQDNPTGHDTRKEKERQTEKRWEDNTPEWTGMTLGAAMRKAERREEWRELVARSPVTPQRSTRLRDRSRFLLFVFSRSDQSCRLFETHFCS